MKNSYKLKHPLYIFVHLSKTGGTTIYKHLLKFFKNEDEIVYLGPEGDTAREILGKPPIENRSEKERKRIKVLIGHKVKLSTLSLVPWREPRFVFFMRHPVARIISKYNYEMHLKGFQNNPIPFEQWVTSLKPNAWDTSFWLCRRFLNILPRYIKDIPKRQKIANDLLQQFYFVSSTERMDSDIRTIFSEMGIKKDMERENVGGRDHKILRHITPEIERKICKLFKSELEFYTKWSKAFPYQGCVGMPTIKK